MTVAEEIARAVEALRRGKLVAFPTETVYGLGADATNEEAVRRLFAVKDRPSDHPVIVHIASDAQLDDYAVDVSDVARRLAAACWPGPLTLVLRRRVGRIVDAVSGGRDTVGLRVPDHRVALTLLREFGGAIAAPSANRFGAVSPTTAEHVAADLDDDVDVIVDGGACTIGVESTIVDCTGSEPVVLRLGAIDAERLAAIVGLEVTRRDDGAIAAPGTLPKHYAPAARVVVVDSVGVAKHAANALARGDRVGLLALASDVPARVPGGVDVLSPPIDNFDYAHVLYARLREADARGIAVLLVVPPPEVGIGAAVTDRIRRAAASATGPQ